MDIYGPLSEVKISVNGLRLKILDPQNGAVRKLNRMILIMRIGHHFLSHEPNCGTGDAVNLCKFGILGVSLEREAEDHLGA